MHKKHIVLLFFFFFICRAGYSATNAYFNVVAGTAYWNSKGLNRLTEGYNSGYGTSFKSIHLPLEIGMEFGIRLNNWSWGGFYGLDYVRRHSTSSIYSYDQTMKLGFMPFGITSKYFWYSNGKISFSSGLVFTAFNTSLSLNSYPNPLGEDNIGMKAWGGALSATIDLEYKLSRRICLLSVLGFRYSDTANFKYTTSTGGHTEGEYVVFNDGTNLTLNLTGLNFLVGLKFYFGEN